MGRTMEIVETVSKVLTVVMILLILAVGLLVPETLSAATEGAAEGSNGGDDGGGMLGWILGLVGGGGGVIGIILTLLKKIHDLVDENEDYKEVMGGIQEHAEAVSAVGSFLGAEDKDQRKQAKSHAKKELNDVYKFWTASNKQSK